MTGFRRLSLALAVGLAVRTVDAATKAGAPFLNSPLSVRQAGMGGVSVGGDDILRVWSNPSLLAAQRPRAVIGLNGSSLFDGVQQTFGAGLGWRMAPRLAVGGLVSAYTVGFQELDESGAPGEDVTERSVAGGIVAASRWRWLTGGATIKYVSEAGGEMEAQGPSGFACDVGMSSGWRGWTMAAAVRNLGAPLRSSGMAVSLPSEQRLGFARGFSSGKLLAAVEYVNSRTGASGAGAGVELRSVGPTAVRIGASGLGGQIVRFSCGLSVVFHGVGIDYALVTHPMGFTHRFSVMLGWGAVETSPQVYKVREMTEEELYDSGAKLYAAGRYNDAIRLASDLTRVNPRHWQAWQLLGNCVFAKGDREGAVKYYRYSLTINPDNQQLKNWLEQIDR